jgi:DNA-directed RNA polymerase specialized sigma24 family protein
MTSQPAGGRTRWDLTQESFDRLLSALDPDRERAAEQYEALRARLLRFFEWQGVTAAEDCADEVLDVAARRLGAGETLQSLHAFCAGVARVVLLAHRRTQIERESRLRKLAGEPSPEAWHADRREREIQALEDCLDRLPGGGRDLMLAYYRAGPPGLIPNRRQLADRLGVPPGALRVRAHRLRLQLAQCMRRALEVE